MLDLSVDPQAQADGLLTTPNPPGHGQEKDSEQDCVSLPPTVMTGGALCQVQSDPFPMEHEKPLGQFCPVVQMAGHRDHAAQNKAGC